MLNRVPLACLAGASARLSDLTASQQRLVRLCQAIDYGQILELRVVGGEPTFDPPPLVVLEVKLDSEDGSRWEVGLDDFALSEEVRRLVVRLGRVSTGRIQRIEIRAGLPRRILIEAQLNEVIR